MALTSAAGILSLLDESAPALQKHGLLKLDLIVDEFWAEICDYINKIESLYEDPAFPERELAALVASKVYYHLGELEESLRFALGAGESFDVSGRTEYIETLIAHAIDSYIASRVANLTSGSGSQKEIDPRLEAIVNRMFQHCLDEAEYKEVIGIGIESWRTDMIIKAIEGPKADKPALLTYAFNCCMTIVQNRDFRHTVLRLLVDLYQTQTVPDYINMCQCLVFLNDFKAVANTLDKLIASTDKDDNLVGYQVAFDCTDSSTQEFMIGLRKAVDALPKSEEEGYADRREKLAGILTGEPSIDYYLQFLYRNSKADNLILKTTKESVSERNSVCHSATVFSHSIMHAGTTTDSFLRENMDWLSRATNWAKFSAVSSLGVIHKGHLKEGQDLLAPYLPGVGGSPYAEGGALFALGLINANHGEGISIYLLEALRGSETNEIIQHGACLGLGVAAMATGNEEIFEMLKNTLFFDSAVAGEAAGLAMGLVMLGSANGMAIEEMRGYALETSHEKIIRGLAMGLAMIMYGQEESADVLIDELSRDKKSATMRYGGMYMIGMAYCGTGNNSAIQRLLHVAVSDTSNDVRRAAVSNLGFVLFRNHEQCPKVVQLLAESYNPHVRYGSAVALGISCAGTGSMEAFELLEPMLSDSSDFVRQGALLACAMIFIQMNDKQNPKVGELNEKFTSVIGDKLEDVMAKFGAILAQGIMNAGGRNVTIGLQSNNGHKNLPGIVGMAVFLQSWYWYPYIHFLSLAFQPTAVIGLNDDLLMPQFSFTSNAPPSTFAYPPKTKVKEKKKEEKIETAVLSTALKGKKKKGAKKDGVAPMDVDGEKGGDTPTGDAEMKDAKDATKDEEMKDANDGEEQQTKKDRQAEASSEVLENPSRVTLPQQRFITFDADERFIPIKAIKSNAVGRVGGIVVLKDRTPDLPVDLVEAAPPAGPDGDDEAEPEAPAPFEYVD